MGLGVTIAGDYDFYLRHSAVSEGEWVGFRLAWRGLAGVEGLERRPHTRTRPWILDPARPDYPSAGSWGEWLWRFEVALLDALAGLSGRPLPGGRGAAEMRADLLGYVDAEALQLKDVDGVIYPARVTAYTETQIEPYDASHPGGGWAATVEFSPVEV